MRQPPRAFSEASPTFNVSIPPAALGQLIPGQSSMKSKKSNTPQSTTSTALRTRTKTNRRNHEFTTNKTHQVFRACRHHCNSSADAGSTHGELKVWFGTISGLYSELTKRGRICRSYDRRADEPFSDANHSVLCSSH